jgi:hypothetical protein
MHTCLAHAIGVALSTTSPAAHLLAHFGLFVPIAGRKCSIQKFDITSGMKIFVILLASIASLPSFAQSKEEQEIISLSRKKFRWMVEAKLDSLRDVLDDRLTYTHSNGWVQSKTDVINDFTNGKLTYKAIDVQELKARVYPSSAIVNGRGKFTVTVNSTMVVIYDLMFTETYVLIGKKWKLAARHSNKM